MSDAKEVEPICDYDHTNEVMMWDEYLQYDIWANRVDPDGDHNDWYGKHNYYDKFPLCFSVEDGFQW